MSTKPLKDPAQDEHILQVEPPPQRFVEAGWRSRPNLYTDRTMSAQALSADQRERAGRLALRGQMVSPGVVAGLEVRLRSELVQGQEGARYSFDLEPGMGLTASGEDVYVLRDMNVRVDRLPVYWPGSLGPAGFDLGLLGSVDAVTTHAGLRAAVLVLVPVVSKREDPPDPNDPGESDPDVHALEDQRLVDGSTLVLFAWPRDWELPPRDSAQDKALWRNRLAWEIFNREQQRPPGQYAPWEEVGVPVALVGFEPPLHYHAPAKPLFVDRAAVVRAGGAPRSRTPLLESRGSPLLWQARSLQFAEQLSSLSSSQLTSPSASSPFELLPPVGALPKESIDLVTWQHRFFPASFILDAVPVPLEQLDAVAQASASLAPLRTSQAERVRVLVPVPEVHFEPHLLREELLDPAFQQAISSALKRLGEWRARRDDLRRKATLLKNALAGKKLEHQYPPDPDRVEGEEPSSQNPSPPEDAYGTQDSHTSDGGFVPDLVNALSRTATWAEPTKRALNTVEVSVAAPSSGGKYAVISRPNTEISSPTHLDVLYFENKAETQERISIDAFWAEFQALWSSDGLRVVVLVHNNKNAQDKPRIRLGLRTGANTWTWREASSTAERELSLPGYTFSHLTAVSWGTGNVDAFVVMSPTDASQGSRILKFTWLKDKPQLPALQTLILNPTRVVDQLVAIDRGKLQTDQHQVELLFMGRAPGESASWLHHAPLVHKAPKADGSDDFELKPYSEVRILKGTRLAACITDAPTSEDPTRKRLDVLVMGQGIRHGWNDGSWKLGMGVVSPTGGETLVALSQGKQIHAFWWESQTSDGPFFYSAFEGSSWSSPALLTRRKHTPALQRGAFGVAQEGANPFDVFLATTEGLQQLKKVHETTKETVDEKGLQGLIKEIDQLNQKVLDFIRDGSSQVQQELQHVRQLMLTSSTEATRLAATGTRGSTLVDSPFLASQGLQNYLTSFSTRARRTQIIRLSDSLEALQQATLLRRDLTARLIDLVREVGKVKEFGLDVTGMTLLGIANTQISSGSWRISLLFRQRATWVSPVETKVVARENISLLSLVNDPIRRAQVLGRISDEPENLRRALSQSRFRWVESDYFATAIRHLENTRTLLQELERRMRNRVSSVESYRKTLVKIEGYWTELDKRLKVVDGEVAEARQDVTVGRALLAEEVVRIDRVNQRRRQVLEQHVPFLVFQRPRQGDLTLDSRSRLLDPGLVEDLLPEVFASTTAAPPELLSYTELLRDSPLKWFSLAQQLLRGLDRLEFIQRTYVRAQARAVQRIPIRVPTYLGYGLTSHALGLSRLLSAREDVIARSRLSFVQYYQPAILETRTWLELQQSAREHLSLGDLIDTSHGRPDVGRDAATELDRISKVATGLYQRFGGVPPAIRLEWAEQMSQYDVPVDLHDLSRLPQWDQLEGTDRREMQTLVDWLFQRVVSTEPEAVSLMNDLVRVCMLLASHAPVNELLSGHVSKPTVAKVGGTIELAVDPARVRIGMNVMVRSGDQTVEAVVEDLSSGVAKARVLSASAATVHLQEKASARFADPSRGPGAFTGYAW
ncbi:hypothetical protein ACN28E_21150 [Archangium lansingense]|uniref:hypothetical protein n=1 Tax=Archangium lansingense TaxID=2995310 RepID=UPI003B7A27E8